MSKLKINRKLICFMLQHRETSLHPLPFSLKKVSTSILKTGGIALLFTGLPSLELSWL
jgi:hypothetical protein